MADADAAYFGDSGAVTKWSCETTQEKHRLFMESHPDAPTIDVDAIAATVSEPLAACDVEKVVSYRIPRVTEDGTCSLPNDLEKEPFCLLPIVFGVHETDAAVLAHSPIVRRLVALEAIVDAIAAKTGAEWVGIYRVVPSPPEAKPSTSEERTLVKEAYFGAPSRPFFPLTLEFASHSNNSTVALTKQTVIIHDVRKIDPDEPYYTCDGKVRSELCTPILNKEGDCIGIIDAEAFRPGHFTPAILNLILDVCEQLGRNGILLA